jgi:tetratricopeptide (TPR) repeat protein
MEQELARERKFVPAILPWVVAALALLIYSLTLNHWISMNGLGHAARTMGMTWGPELHGPLFYLVTFPFRWLPDVWVPLALNVFSMVCAVLTLALLARSVALLPHDRTLEQRQREQNEYSMLSVRGAWIPPVLVAAVCGLQLTFWEHATAVSAEIFDLLLFAYIVRCLLEFRMAERDSWLMRAVLVYGLAVPNNWAMIGFFPVFVAALIWLKGLSFFNARFLTRTLLCGTAGLLLYLLLPLVQTFSDGVTISFWEALKQNLGFQRAMLSMLLFNKLALLQGPFGKPLWILALTSLLPLLVISIRWPSQFGDSSQLGAAMTTWIFHLAHAVMLGACIWVVFDPAFSPRSVGLVPFLTLYYIGALCVGYLAGYFLLVFIPRPMRSRKPQPMVQLIHRTATLAVYALLVLTPAALIYKNLPQIQVTNGPAVREYASLLARDLPEDAVVLSDDPRKLFLLQAVLAGAANPGKRLLLDTKSLPSPDYHKALHKRYGGTWKDLPDPAARRPLDHLSMLGLLVKLSERSPIYYLHPSFGYFFEYFTQRPHGMVYELTLAPKESLAAPPLEDTDIAFNETFWTEIDAGILEPLSGAITPPEPGRTPGFREGFMAKLHVGHEPNPTARLLGSYFSRSLNHWGVQMQRAGHLPEAAAHFIRAIDLNPDNLSATVNLGCNENLQAGRRAEVKLSKSIEDQFGKFRDWDQVIGENGPFDEPTFCFQQGQTLGRNALYRQAAQEFFRVTELVPNDLAAHLWLARLHVITRLPDRALELVGEIKSRSTEFQLTSTNQLELLLVEASALFVKNDSETAGTLLDNVVRKNPRDEVVLGSVVQLCMSHGRFSNALEVVEHQLKLDPADETALVNKGYLHLQLGEYPKAIQPLTRVLAVQTNNYPAMLNRAIAYLRSDQLDSARADYETLQKVFPRQFQIYYGLGEIAFREKDTNAAIRYYELYLANAIPNSQESKFITERVAQLKAGPAP